MPKNTVHGATLRERVLDNLAREGGICSDSGQATRALAQRLRLPDRQISTVSSTLTALVRDGAVEREANGRRTFSLRLSDPAPNGHKPKAVVGNRQAMLAEVLVALEEFDALTEENENLQKELGKAEQTIEAQQLQIAALERQVTAAQTTSKLVNEFLTKVSKIS